MSSVAPENEPQILPRNPFPRPGPLPDWRVDNLYLELPPSLVARDDPTSTSSSSPTSTKCGKDDNSGSCEKYFGSSGSDTTLPIVLGVLIPLGIALVVLVYLHRRHVKKLRREDAEDANRSLDFGLGESGQVREKKHSKKHPEMSLASEKEMGIRRERGMSLDLGPHNPYLLPPELQGSRESLQSLSRNVHPADDKYRPTAFIPDDGSIRAPSIHRGHGPFDDSSSYTGSSSQRFHMDSRQNLLRSEPGTRTASPDLGVRKPLPPAKNSTLPTPSFPDASRDSMLSTNSGAGGLNALRASSNYLGQFISGGTPSPQLGADKKEPTATVQEVQVESPQPHVAPPAPVAIKNTPPARISSPNAPQIQEPVPAPPNITLSSPEEPQPRLPQLSFIESQDQKQLSGEFEQAYNSANFSSNNTPQHSTFPSIDTTSNPNSKHQSAVATNPTSKRQSTQSTQSTQNFSVQHSRRQSVQSAMPTHQEEEEDYYDEYEAYGYHDQHYDSYQDYQDYAQYDDYSGHGDRRSMMGMRPLPPDDPSENPEQRANRIRSFYKEYFEETKGQNYPQQPQYYDGAEDYYYDDQGMGGHPGYYDQGYHTPRGMSQAGNYGRHRATISNGSYQSAPGGRAWSTMSGRYGGPRMAPKKKLPPPKALHVLPTPHKLKEDTFIPIDFAPPKKFSNQRAGTPDSPRGGLRPYSPGMKANILASSYDDLAVMPSP
jgi:hypothetical protein